MREGGDSNPHINPIGSPPPMRILPKLFSPSSLVLRRRTKMNTPSAIDKFRELKMKGKTQPSLLLPVSNPPTAKEYEILTTQNLAILSNTLPKLASSTNDSRGGGGGGGNANNFGSNDMNKNRNDIRISGCNNNIKNKMGAITERRLSPVYSLINQSPDDLNDYLEYLKALEIPRTQYNK
jgi:hypothetical protein